MSRAPTGPSTGPPTGPPPPPHRIAALADKVGYADHYHLPDQLAMTCSYPDDSFCWRCGECTWAHLPGPTGPVCPDPRGVEKWHERQTRNPQPTPPRVVPGGRRRPRGSR